MFLMDEKIGEEYTIHLSDLDEFLASRLLETEKMPLGLSVSKHDSQGNIVIQQKSNENRIEEGGIDFELSPSEYQSLDSIDISDFTNRTVYTSSAYDFFDFLLMYFSYVDCILDFSGSSWRIKILNFKEVDKS